MSDLEDKINPANRQVIELGGAMDPNEEKQYRDKIARARAGGVDAIKGHEPVGREPRPNIPYLSGTQNVQPRPPGSPVLRSETQEQLEEIQRLNQEEEKKGLDEEEVKSKAEKAKEDLLDLFDFEARSEAERILKNKKRKADIESRCDPMNFEDLLYKDEVQQTVPIVSGKFEPRYRSMTPEESLFIKRYMAKEQSPSDQYALEKYGLCILAVSLVSINGKLLPDHRDKDGSPNEEHFERKLKTLTKKSGYIIADLGVNYEWFDLRVRKLINPDDLKNG